MNKKHTPGPWSVDWAIVTVGGSPQVVEFFVRRDGDSVAIASDIVDPDTGVRSAENARLIAAAPDLLSAVIGLLHLDTDHQRGADDDDVCAEVRAAREAVAKAVGHDG